MKAAVIGGDKRMVYAAEALLDSGMNVAVAGWDRLHGVRELRVTAVDEAVGWADIIVLPLHPFAGGALNCPYSDREVALDAFARMVRKKPVFCGFADGLTHRLIPSVYDYAAREEFAVSNAVLTAEGAIALLLREYEDSVLASEILVSGYGRIGKTLSRYLTAMGAKVTVAARKPSDRAWIEANGWKADDYSLKEINKYQIIINTVPASVFRQELIDRMNSDVMIIDLASAPGGVDYDRAEERGLTCIRAPGLPAKTAPKAAGRIIKDTIIRIIKEENGGRDYSGLCDDRLLLHL